MGTVPIYRFPHYPLITFDTSSLASARQIFDWLDECRRNHPDCRKGDLRPVQMHGNPSPKHYMPKRVLEISSYQLVLREHLASKRQYACLSHSWGPNGVSFQLKTSTLGALKQGISISALPKTFRDAVLVCMRLGIRLIWIDALCQSSIIDKFYHRFSANETQASCKTVLAIGKKLPQLWRISTRIVSSLLLRPLLLTATQGAFLIQETLPGRRS